MTHSIAIKLGSSHTSIFKQGEGIVLFEPSLVAYTGTGKSRQVIAVGNKAKKMQGRTDDATIVESPIFEGRIADAELAVTMLRSYLAKVIKFGIIRPIVKAVLCVPIGLSLVERKAFEKVCYMAGIQDVTIVPACICGALGYNLPVTEPRGVCLVNIGGGSTDIAVVSMNSIVAGVNIGIGGEVMDLAIEKKLEEKYKLIIGKGVAASIKNEIGSLYKNDMSNTEVCGIDAETKLAKTIVVEASDIFEAIEKYYEKIVDAIKSVLNNCPPNLVEDVDHEGVFLFGGASLITGAEQFFRKRLEMNVKVEDYTTAIDVIGAGKLLSDQALLKKLSEV